MTELLFFKWDHSTQSIPTPSAGQLSNLPSRFDIIEARPSDTLTALSWSGGVVTATMTGPHNVPIGQPFQIQGVTPAGYNGVFKARAGTTGSTLVYNLAANPGPATVTGMVGWPWGNEELRNPMFRIITWNLLQISDAMQFMDSIPATYDSSAPAKLLTHFRYRQFFLDLSAASIPAPLKTWWQDDTRAVPKFTVTLSPAAVIAAVKSARSVIQAS